MKVSVGGSNVPHSGTPNISALLQSEAGIEGWPINGQKYSEMREEYSRSFRGLGLYKKKILSLSSVVVPIMRWSPKQFSSHKMSAWIWNSQKQPSTFCYACTVSIFSIFQHLT